MATRSAIGIEYGDGEIVAVYCHWDGYISHNGQLLSDHYFSRALASSLIALGGISVLDNSVETTTFYIRDMDRPALENAPERFSSREHFIDEFGSGVNYLYLIDESAEWQVMNLSADSPVFMPLSEVLCRGIVMPLSEVLG